jgi:hypothetical protein
MEMGVLDKVRIVASFIIAVLTGASLPFGILALIVLLTAWPRNVGIGQRLTLWDTVKKVDLLGNFLIVVASTLLIFSLQEAGAFTYDWTSPAILVSLAFASLSWVSFVTWELFLGLKNATRVEPILPLRLIAQRVYFGALV